jgi:hypothetical protein
MAEIIFILPSIIFMAYLVFNEPDESEAMKKFKEIINSEENGLESLKCRNAFLVKEISRLEQIMGYLN